MWYRIGTLVPFLVHENNLPDNLADATKERYAREAAKKVSLYLDSFNLVDVVPALNILAKKYGYVLRAKKGSCLTGPQCLAIQDHMQGISNALLRLKQSVEHLCRIRRCSHLISLRCSVTRKRKVP